ncbi:MAG: hypothetical protein WB762_25790 [Candidatus Sulfotelmatobacter sp.]
MALAAFNVAWAALLSKFRTELTPEQAEIVDAFKQQCPGFAVMRKLVLNFRSLLRVGKLAPLPAVPASEPVLISHLVMRAGRWVFLDFLGKGNKTRSVAVPLWVKQEIDGWLDVAGIEKGPIFRRVLANGRVGKDALTERAVWQLVREYAAQIGIGELAPHDLRKGEESQQNEIHLPGLWTERMGEAGRAFRLLRLL